MTGLQIKIFCFCYKEKNMSNKKLHLSEKFLKKRYISDKKTIDQIAKECGVSVQLIYRQLKKFGIKK
jgi:DNA-binding MurR/RpiR family transcriptional regulator